jgi:hypothetical protein
MAVATYTSTVFDNFQPKQNATGNVTVSGQFRGGATAYTVGDIIFLAKVPHGAKIVEFAVDHSTSETALGMDYGMASGGSIAGGGADMSQFAAALAKATIIRSNKQRVAGDDGQRVSVSNDSGVRYGIFAVKPVSGSATTSLIVNFSITYRSDD